MNAQSSDFSNFISTIRKVLPPVADLTDRTKDALASLGAALVLDLYETVRREEPIQKPTAPNPAKTTCFDSERWTEADVQLLRARIGSTSFRDLATELGRTEHAVRQKAMKLGLKAAKQKLWTKRELIYLKEHYATQKVSEIAKRLGRSINSVSNKAQKLGLVHYDPDRPASRSPWTESELEYLREHRADDIVDVAAALGRSTGAVYMKCAAEGIPRQQTDTAKNDRDDRIRQLRAKGLTRAQISERLGVPGSIVSRVSRNGSAGTGRRATTIA